MSVNQCEQRVVLTNTHVRTRVETCTTLTHDDGASADQFATKSLDTQHLWLGITTVSRRAAAFFLCHDIDSF